MEYTWEVEKFAAIFPEFSDQNLSEDWLIERKLNINSRIY